MGHAFNIESQLQLIEAIKANDSLTLKSLYKENYPKVEHMVLNNSGTKDHAKDVYQDAFICVYNHIKNSDFKPQNETALQGYLYQIARNKWMDVLRSSKFKKTNMIYNEMHIVDKIMDQDNQEDHDLFRQQLKRAMDAFKLLGSPCQELLTTFYFENKSLREIADKLEIEENTARNKKYRCMEKLRELVLAPKS